MAKTKMSVVYDSVRGEFTITCKAPDVDCYIVARNVWGARVRGTPHTARSGGWWPVETLSTLTAYMRRFPDVIVKDNTCGPEPVREPEKEQQADDVLPPAVVLPSVPDDVTA